jgi:hypothetical protein
MNATNRRTSRRRGMALPVVIVVLLVLGASLTGGVMVARGERVIDDAGKVQVLAKSYAETALNRALMDRSGLGMMGMPGASDSVRVTVTNVGYYDVITTRLRTAVGTTVPGLYLVRAHAVITQTGTAGGPSGEYTVTKLATWKAGSMTVQSAMTGVNGIEKAGNAGAISGVDQCPVGSGGTGTTIPAVAVPTTAADGGPGYQGMTGPLDGNPDVSTLGANPAAAAAAIPIDWAGIVAGTSITFDLSLPASGTGFPNSGWFTANPNAWPVIFVNNGPPNSGTEFVLPNFGRGLLIVYDDLNLNGNTAGWDGIILVGGRLRSNGTNAVSGATVTGLNVQLGVTPAANDVNDLNGTKDFYYDSCKVSSATGGLGRFRPYNSTWSNTFKVY